MQERQHWWMRWGYKTFWVLVLLSVTSCNALTPANEITVNDNGLPNSTWARIELYVQGVSYYERQLELIEGRIERSIEDRVRHQKRLESLYEMYLHKDRMIIRREGNQVIDPAYIQAARLENEATYIREKAVQETFMRISIESVRKYRELREKVAKNLSFY